MSKILLIVTGSIAAYKTIDLVRDLEAKGHEVNIIMTAAAKHFVTPLTYLSLTKAKVFEDDVFGNDAMKEPMLHIELAKHHDLVIVSPATSDYIAKMSIGIGDTLSLCMLLVYNGKLIVAPAMNPNMLNHPATKQHITTLKSRGMKIAEPIYGTTACKDVGYGKYIGNEKILELVNNTLNTKQRLSGIKATITLGGTREMIDPVRFIGNSSSGQQGALIAHRLIEEGADVTVIAGYTSFPLPGNCKIIRAYSAEEMLKASLESLPTDIFIGCAAVCDFRPSQFSSQKIKKQGDKNLAIDFTPNPDIVASIAKQEKPQRPKMVVGFALEAENHLENAKKKFRNKGVDLLVLNHVALMGKDFNNFTLLEKDDVIELGERSKSELAISLAEKIIQRML